MIYRRKLTARPKSINRSFSWNPIARAASFLWSGNAATFFRLWMYHHQDSEVMTSSSISSHTLSRENRLKPRPRATDWRTGIRDKAGSVYETKIYDAKTALVKIRNVQTNPILLIDQSKQGLCFESHYYGHTPLPIFMKLRINVLRTKAKWRKYKGILFASCFKMVGDLGLLWQLRSNWLKRLDYLS